MKKEIYCVGTINLDFALNIEQIPTAGHYTFSKSEKIIVGGKAFVFASSLSKYNIYSTLNTVAGNDFLFEYIQKSVGKNEYITLDETTITPCDATGQAFIFVKENETYTYLAGGYSQEISIKYDEDQIQKSDFIYTTLDFGRDNFLSLLKYAKKYHKPVLCDLAPISFALDDSELKDIDYLTGNNIEFSQAFDTQINDISEAKDFFVLLKQKGARNLIMTFGDKGVICLREGDKEPKYFEGIQVKVVDPTGAGDIFRASFVYKLISGSNFYESIQFANIAAAISVTRQGASSSCPNAQDINSYLLQKLTI